MQLPPDKKIYFASDQHLGAPTAELSFPREQKFVAWLNEVNPCPGSFGYFLWEAAEKPVLFTALLDHLVEEARTRHRAGQLPSDPTPTDARLFRRPQ